MAVATYKSWRKKDDPASQKIRDKIHFYESFGELDIPMKRSKASDVRKRQHSAMLHTEDYLKFRSVDNLLKNNMLHRRAGSYVDFRGEDSPPPRARHQSYNIAHKAESSLSLMTIGGGSSGDEGKVEMILGTSPETGISDLTLIGNRSPVNGNSKDERNELLELQKERKVKSTLVLLKKQHPSYVEERLDWALSTVTLPTPRTSHTCTLYGSSIVLIAGDNGAADVHFLDVDKLTWGTPRVTGARAAPTSMHGHDCCRIGNRFYIFGGYVNNQFSNKLHILSLIDDATVHWSQPRVSGNSPSPRMGHTLTRYSNKFILFGGFDGRSWLSDIHFLDTDTMTWSQPVVHGKEPEERCGHTATIVGDRMIVLGGNDSNGEFNDINMLQLNSMTWVQGNPIGEQPPERTYHATARVGRNLIVTGGKREGVILRDVWLLQAGVTEKICWYKVTGSQPTQRAHHSLVRADSRLFLLGGKGPANCLLDEIWSTNTAIMAPMSLSSLPVVEYPEIKLEKEIGTGNFSKVIRGIWKQKDVAVKKITLKKEKNKNDVLIEFKSEVALLGNLRHPNLVTCFGYCLSPMCIVMEYLPGSLYDFIHVQKSDGETGSQKVDPTLLLQFAFDIARGMQYLHSQNIIHRDLKSSNLLLDKHLNVKIADLGIAREATHTQTMTTIGTVAWTAPEILRHDSYNQLADVYSYAIVLWELITGKVPYSGMPPMNAGILVASNQLRPELPADVDPDWRHLVTWCWSEEPTKRPNFDATLAYLAANC